MAVVAAPVPDVAVPDVAAPDVAIAAPAAAAPAAAVRILLSDLLLHCAFHDLNIRNNIVEVLCVIQHCGFLSSNRRFQMKPLECGRIQQITPYIIT